MSDVCIYTANFGGYDTLRAQVAQDIDVDWLYFTDRVRGTLAPAPWVEYPMHTEQPTPILAAKWWKTHPPFGYEYAIWIDANMEITSPSFARETIASRDVSTPGLVNPNMAGGVEPMRPVLRQAPLAVWRHPRRDCIYDEIDASLGVEAQGGKYDASRLRAQGEAYERAGYPAHNGLYACGTVVWTPDAWPVGEAWWDECVFWSPQDQVSLPFVLWAKGVTPAVFPVRQIDRVLSRGKPYLANRWLRIWPHR